MKTKKLLLIVTLASFVAGCSSFQAKRVGKDEGDTLALKITDKWVARDTEDAIKATLKQISAHKGFQQFLAKSKGKPKVFIAEVQNETSEPYFPIADMNDELLTEISAAGDFTLIDAAARTNLLKEIQYQNDGMVDAKQVKKIGKASGADLLIFGSVRMNPESRDGKTIKQYSVNMRMTNIETNEEVLRTRYKTEKFSDQKSTGW